MFKHPHAKRLDYPRQPCHQFGWLNTGHVRCEHTATRVRNVNAIAELGRGEPAVVVFCETQASKTSEHFLCSRDLCVMPCCGHHASTMMKIAVDALFGEDLACA